MAMAGTAAIAENLHEIGGPTDSWPGQSGMSNTFSDIVAHLKLMLKYLHRNAWTIVFIIAGGYFCYSQGIL